MPEFGNTRWSFLWTVVNLGGTAMGAERASRNASRIAPLEPSSMSQIALVVKTYGEMDPIQLGWMVNQMESYKRKLGSPFHNAVD